MSAPTSLPDRRTAYQLDQELTRQHTRAVASFMPDEFPESYASYLAGLRESE